MLTDLGMAHLVLAYYDSYFEWKLLMSQLSKGCREAWQKNEKAFVYSLPTLRIPLKYFCDFNKEIADFLLQFDRYLRYQLEVTVETAYGSEWLIEFLKSATYAFKVQFTHIHLSIDRKLPIFVNNFTDFLIEMDMPMSCLNLKSSNLQMDCGKYAEYKDFKFRLFGELLLKSSKDLRYCHSIYNLKIPSFAHRLIPEIDVPVNTLTIWGTVSLQKLIDLEFTSTLKESLKILRIECINYDDDTFKDAISDLQSRFTCLTEVIIDRYETKRTHELLEILTNVDLGVGMPNVSFSKHNSTPIKLMKQNMDIFYKDVNKCKLYQAK